MIPKNRKRLTLDIPFETHRDLKVTSAEHRITMKKFVLVAIMEKLARNDPYSPKEETKQKQIMKSVLKSAKENGLTLVDVTFSEGC